MSRPNSEVGLHIARMNSTIFLCLVFVITGFSPPTYCIFVFFLQQYPESPEHNRKTF